MTMEEDFATFVEAAHQVRIDTPDSDVLSPMSIDVFGFGNKSVR
jgi:hypothetical protein